MKYCIQSYLILLLIKVCFVFPQTNQENPDKKLFKLHLDSSEVVLFSYHGQTQFAKKSSLSVIFDSLLNNEVDYSSEYYSHLSCDEDSIFVNFQIVLPEISSLEISDFSSLKAFESLTQNIYNYSDSWSHFTPDISYKENIKAALTNSLLSNTASNERFRFVRSSFMDELKGLQYSLVNFADDIEGGQAGALNVSNLVSGFQIGLVNIGGDIDGVQIGLINISDTIKGLPIGIINYSKMGNQRLICWTDNLYRYNLGIKFEVNNTYSIIHAGQGNIYKNIENSISYGARYGYQFNINSYILGADIGYLRMDNEDYFVTAGKSDENALSINIISGIDFLEDFSLIAGYGLNYIWSDLSGIGSGSFYGHILFGIEFFSNN